MSFTGHAVLCTRPYAPNGVRDWGMARCRGPAHLDRLPRRAGLLIAYRPCVKGATSIMTKGAAIAKPSSTMRTSIGPVLGRWYGISRKPPSGSVTPTLKH